MLSIAITLNLATIAAGASLSGPVLSGRVDAGRDFDAGGLDGGAS